VVKPNTTSQIRLVRWSLPEFTNTYLCNLSIVVRLFNTLPHAHHYWAWCVDINDGWLDRRNLRASDPTDFEGGSNTIL